MDWKALFQEAENTWLYIRETDNNFTFHVHAWPAFTSVLQARDPQ